MKNLKLSRRRLLGGMLAAPVLSLTGCSGGGPGLQLGAESQDPKGSAATINVPGSTVPATGPLGADGQLKPPFVYFKYDGYADEPEDVEDALPAVPSDVTPTNDRFAQGALCYEFRGVSSRVVIDPFAGAPQSQQDFALLFWVQSSSAQPMQAIQYGPTGEKGLLVQFNADSVLSISSAGVTISVPIGGNLLTLTDNSWHHIAIQRFGGFLQILVDGILRQTQQFLAPLPSNPEVIIGGGWEGALDGVRLYNRAFPAQSIPQSVYAWTQVKPNTGAEMQNVAGYFPFFGNAQNYLGQGMDGTASNVTLTSDRYGSADAAYLFNGTNSSVTFSPGLESTAGDFAVGFWEQSSAAGQMTAFSASVGGIDGTGLDVVFNGAAAVQVYVDGIPIPALAMGVSGALTDGTWHFIVLQRAAGDLQLYIDGALVVTADNASTFFGSTSVMQAGAGSGSSAAVANYWIGALDDVQFYEFSLTPQQVSALLTLSYPGRDGAGALSFQGKMWLLGGWNGGYAPATNSEVWSSTDGLNWTRVTVAPWERRHDAGYAVLNDRMWIVGGDRNTGHYQNDVWSSADGVNWQQVTDDVPWANRATQYVLTFNNRLWLMGGQQIFETGVPPGPVVAYRDVWSSADGANWVLETAEAAWSPRGMIMGAAVFQGKMWVIGGGLYDIRTFNNDVWSSADGVNWTLVQSAAPWSPRQFQNITVFDNKLWVVAGGVAGTQGGTNDVWYSSDGAQWTQLGATPWQPRHAATGLVYNNYLWLTCGSYTFGDNDVWRMGYAP
jgi:Concanavalin A-like lectin/glucanases superfamily